MTDEPEPITAPQQRRLHTMFGKADITDRAEKLKYASKVVGRELASSAELTKAEAATVMDSLAARLAFDPIEPSP